MNYDINIDFGYAIMMMGWMSLINKRWQWTQQITLKQRCLRHFPFHILANRRQ